MRTDLHVTPRGGDACSISAARANSPQYLPIKIPVLPVLFRSLLLALVLAADAAATPRPVFPLHVSENRRYLVDQTGRPFFVMGDTPWFVQKLKINDVRMLMDDRVAKGLNRLFLELLDDSRISSRDGYGNAAFETDADARAGMPGLRSVKLKDGWLGDIDSVSNTWATIAPWDEFRGDKSRAAWFPNRAVACVWRAWQSKNSPVLLEAASADGLAKLPAWSTKVARDLMLDPGVDVVLSVEAGQPVKITRVQFLDGDTVLGEAASPPWRFTWHKPAPGAHAVHAIWEGDQEVRGAVDPVLVVVRTREVK